MCDAGTAPSLSFTRSPPTFQQMRPTLLSPLLRPSRRASPPLRLTIPPLPVRPQRRSLALRFRTACLAAAGLGFAPAPEQRL